MSSVSAPFLVIKDEMLPVIDTSKKEITPKKDIPQEKNISQKSGT